MLAIAFGKVNIIGCIYKSIYYTNHMVVQYSLASGWMISDLDY